LDFISKSTSAYIKCAAAHLLYAQANLETKRKAFERLEISSKSYRDGSVMQACLSGSTRFNGRINNVEEITPSGRMATGVAVSPSHYGLLMITKEMASSPFLEPGRFIIDHWFFQAGIAYAHRPAKGSAYEGCFLVPRT
jgi:hypothetical protein